MLRSLVGSEMCIRDSFNTTSGSIIPVARLTAGKATAVLTSGTTPSIAQVTVFVGSSSTTAEVEFVAGDVQVKEIVLQAEGDIAYSVDRGLLIGADTTLTHGDLSISAATVEFEEQVGQVRAQGDVAVSSGGSMIHADALWYSPENEAGAVLIAGPSPQVVSFRSGLLKLSAPIPALDLQAFELFKPDNTRTCLLYTSDAADDLLCVDLGGRRIIKKKKHQHLL